METIVYGGIDVRKEQNTVCLYSREKNTGRIPARTEYMVRAMRKA